MRAGSDSPPVEPGCRVLVMRGTGWTGAVEYRLPASPRLAVRVDPAYGGGLRICEPRELARLGPLP